MGVQRKMCHYLIDEAQDSYQNSSQSINGCDPGIHNRLIPGNTFYIFDDEWTSTTRAGAAYCPCCSRCITQFCHRNDNVQ